MSSERTRELRRRRKRKAQITKLKNKFSGKKLSAEAVEGKLRKMTPGAEQILANLEIK